MTRRPAAWLGSVLGVAVLLAGVLAGTVTAEAMLLAAWLENLSAGLATVVTLLRTPGGRLVLGPNVQVSGIPVHTAPDGTRSIPVGCAAGFFAAHFGLFTVVHGVFLGAAVAVRAFSGADGAAGAGLSRTALAVIVVAAVLRVFRRVDPRRAIVQAYAGLAPVHLGVLLLFTSVIDLDAVGAAGRGPALAVVGLLLAGDLVRAAAGGGPRAADPPTPTPTVASTPLPPPPPPSPGARRPGPPPTVRGSSDPG